VEANRKRSEAQAGITKAEIKERVRTKSPKKYGEPGKEAKAAASKTNTGAVARGDKLVKNRPDLAEKVRLGLMKPAEAHRQMKRDEVKEKVRALPPGKYRIIYADPPWKYGDGHTGDLITATGALHHYPTMSLLELKALDVPSLAAVHYFSSENKIFLLTSLVSYAIDSIMEAQYYTLKDVAEIFPNLNPRTVQVWVKKGVIRPAIVSSGQGFPVRFNYLNLIEIGLVWQIVRLGLDSHAFFLEVMEFARKYQLTNRWIDGRYNFDCFFIYPELTAFGKKVDETEGQEYVKAPPFHLVSPEELFNLFQGDSVAGWLVVDIRVIKKMVDAKLKGF